MGTDRNTFYRILWLIPLFLLLHNLEEAITMPQWLETHGEVLRDRFWIFQSLQFNSLQIYISLLNVTIIPCGLSVWWLLKGLTKTTTAILLLLQSIIFWNAFVPHLAGVFLLQMYNPGAYTAVLFNIPFSIILWRVTVKAGILQSKKLAIIVLAGSIVYLPLVYGNHFIAKAVSLLLMS